MKFGHCGEFPAVLAFPVKKVIHLDLALSGASSRWGNPAQHHPASVLAVPSSSARPV